MSASASLYARASDILTDAATVTVTAGTAAALYPVANIRDRAAHTVSRSTGTTISFRAVFGAAKTLQAVVLINTNATTALLTNAAGLSQAIAIPATPADGLHLDPWIDLRFLANTSSTTWTIALTGPTGVALGEWLLVETLRPLPILWDGLDEDEGHPAIQHQTDYGVKLKLGFGVRQRAVRGRVIHESFRPQLLALQRDAQGALRSFLLVLDRAQNDALFVDLGSDSRSVSRIHTKLSGAALTFVEQVKGWL